MLEPWNLLIFLIIGEFLFYRSPLRQIILVPQKHIMLNIHASTRLQKVYFCKILLSSWYFSILSIWWQCRLGPILVVNLFMATEKFWIIQLEKEMAYKVRLVYNRLQYFFSLYEKIGSLTSNVSCEKWS